MAQEMPVQKNQKSEDKRLNLLDFIPHTYTGCSCLGWRHRRYCRYCHESCILQSKTYTQFIVLERNPYETSWDNHVRWATAGKSVCLQGHFLPTSDQILSTIWTLKNVYRYSWETFQTAPDIWCLKMWFNSSSMSSHVKWSWKVWEQTQMSFIQNLILRCI